MSHAAYVPLTRKSSDNDVELDATYVHISTRQSFREEELEEDDFDNLDETSAILLEDLQANGIPRSSSKAPGHDALDDSPAAMVRRVSIQHPSFHWKIKQSPVECP